MNKNFWIAFTAIVAIIAVFLYVTYPSGTWKYKMTVTVETPEGDVTGSAVREVTSHTEPVIFAAQGAGAFASVSDGEAVVVDLEKRGVLFALMSGWPYGRDYNSKIMLAAFPSGEKRFTPQSIRYYKSLKDTKVVLDESHYPTFLHFKNPKDITSAELVMEMGWKDDPDGHGKYGEYVLKENKFEKIFGKGVKLKEISIETTDEPVTKVIDKYLPPFGPQWAKWQNSLPVDSSLKFDKLDFKRGK